MADVNLNPGNPEDIMDITIENDASGEQPGTALARHQPGNGQVALLEDAPVTFTRAMLEIVYGVGESSQQGFRGASLALRIGPKAARRWVELVPAKTPLVVLVTGVQEVWREYVQYAPGVFPREFASRQDAIKAGLTDQWTGVYPNGTGPTVSPCMYLDLFIRKPAGVDDDLFCLRLDDNWYAPATFRADKQLYDPIATAVKLRLKKDAGERGVPLVQAKMDKAFMTLTSFASMKGAKTNYQVVLGSLLEDGKPVLVSDKFKQDFLNLMTVAREAPIADEEEV